MIARTGRLVFVSMIVATGIAASCTSQADLDPPTMADERPRDYTGLHNVVAYHEGYYSGSVPEGDAGFDTLAGLGVRTIISVDGAEPDLARARARGMRYVHLPVGYNGFDDERRLQLVRAMRDAMDEGPVYIHCHHGKHRSAGAAGAVVASLGWLEPGAAVERMKVSGTSPSYRGLYACVAGATILGAATIDRIPATFPEISVPTGLVKGMIEVDEIDGHFKAIEKVGWTVPPDHPDLVPAAEAGRMADLFRVLAEHESARSKPPEYSAKMREAGELAQVLEDMLAAGETEAARLSGQLTLVAASCKDCHVTYRD